MSHLLLDSLRIVNFRVFRDFKIPHLGRVNLLVGRNNIGKTSVLEALWLYARRGSPAAIRDILEARDETRLPTSTDATDAESQALAIKYLIYGRKEIGKNAVTLEIGPIEALEKTLTLSIQWHKPQTREEGVSRLVPLHPDEYGFIDNPVLAVVLTIGSQTMPARQLTLAFERGARASLLADKSEFPNIFVPSSGPSEAQIVKWRDRSVIEGKKNYVLTALKLIAPEVEDVDLVGDQRYGRLLPVVKLTGIDNYIPMRSLGDGMNRLFALALALVNAQDGLLLIDEIENGVHYAVQPDMWRLIMQVATDLNVQVFATTHSKDCVHAFSKVANEHSEVGTLIRLGRKEGNVIATTFDEEELEIATEQNIEVR